jgi:hypothetical protein
MKFFKYFDIHGKEQVGSFCDSWEEVPFTAFLEWQKLIPAMQEIGATLKAYIESLAAENKKYLDLVEVNLTKLSDAEKQSIAAQKEKVLQTVADFHNRYKELKSKKLLPLELQAISLFTDVSPESLALMPIGDEKTAANQDLEHWFDAKENSVEFLKLLLYSLANKPLPNGNISEIIWQTKTDAEIDELQKQYAALKLWEKMLGKGRKLKAEIKAAISGKYKAVDIWHHTTYANSKMQETAKDIVKEMQVGKWDNAPTLIAMIFVESEQNKAALLENSKGGGVVQYSENYATNYKKVFERNYDLFFGQKNKLSIAHVIAIRNFFFIKAHK